MSEPSNIRINPFVGDGGTTTYINLTETHIIPSVSPYVIRLNEVPEKQDPSNIRAVWVDSTTGAVTASALTEVAATPAAGEFRPDYATKADGNDNWNTGLIEFSAVDAGKIVQISYTGMGTLAAVQSNKYPSWYTDRGDGSDGDFIPEADCAISGVKNYKSVFIKEGVTVTVDVGVVFKTLGAFINFGTVKSIGPAEGGNGGNASTGSGKNGENGLLGVGGAGAARGNVSGGVGGACRWFGDTNMQLDIAKNISAIICFGYGAGGGGGAARTASFTTGTGGKGGAGGGHIQIICKELFNAGIISSSGQPGGVAKGDFSPGGGGGGGGGAVFVIADAIVGKGTISAVGGIGGSGVAGGAAGANGGDGIVVIKQLGAL